MSMKNTVKLMFILALAIIAIVMFGSNVEAASFSVSQSSVSLEPGQSKTISISGSGVTGKFTISSSSSNVSVSPSSVWIENNSASVTITAGSAEGSANITISATNAADSETGDNFTGSKAVSVSVTKPVVAPPTNPVTPPTQPTQPAAKSSNANLSNFGIRPNDFSGFTGSKTSYSTTVPYGVSRVEIYASKGHSAQTISGTGSKSLDTGSNVFNVKVTAEDGTTKTYTLTIVRLAEEEQNNPDIEQSPAVKPALASLLIKNGKINEAFDPENLEYTGEIVGDIENIELIAVGNTEDAKVEIVYPEEINKDGENVVTITVTSADGTETRTYTIKVTIIPEEVEEQEEIVPAIVGSTDNGGTGSSGATAKKVIFTLATLAIAGIGIAFAIIEYIKGQKEESIDFSKISTRRAVKDAAVATGKITHSNLEGILHGESNAAEETGARGGSRFK